MQFDREALKKLMTLNDAQLRFVINRLASENGIDLSGFDIRPDDISSVRRALGTATDEDIRNISAQLNDSKRGRRGNR